MELGNMVISEELDCDQEISITIQEYHAEYIDKGEAIKVIQHLIKVFNLPTLEY